MSQGATDVSSPPTLRESATPGLSDLLPEYAFGYSIEELDLLDQAGTKLLNSCRSNVGLAPLASLVDLATVGLQRDKLAHYILLPEAQAELNAYMAGSPSQPTPTSLAVVGGADGSDCITQVYERFSGAGAGFQRNDLGGIGVAVEPVTELLADPSLSVVAEAWQECMADAGYTGAVVGRPDDSYSNERAVTDARCRTSSGYREAVIALLEQNLAEFTKAHQAEIEKVLEGKAQELKVATAILQS